MWSYFFEKIWINENKIYICCQDFYDGICKIVLWMNGVVILTQFIPWNRIMKQNYLELSVRYLIRISFCYAHDTFLLPHGLLLPVKFIFTNETIFCEIAFEFFSTMYEKCLFSKVLLCSIQEFLRKQNLFSKLSNFQNRNHSFYQDTFTQNPKKLWLVALHNFQFQTIFIFLNFLVIFHQGLWEKNSLIFYICMPPLDTLYLVNLLFVVFASFAPCTFLENWTFLGRYKVDF